MSDLGKEDYVGNGGKFKVEISGKTLNSLMRLKEKTDAESMDELIFRLVEGSE